MIKGICAATLALTTYPIHPDVEAAPEKYRTGDVTAVYVYVRDVDKECRSYLGDLPDHKVFMACYVPILTMILLPPQDGSLKWEALKAHEEAHARGWRHHVAN